MSARPLADLEKARGIFQRSLLGKPDVAVPRGSATQSEGAAAPSVVLGKSTKQPSGPTPPARPSGAGRHERRDERFALRDRLAALTSIPRVRKCGLHRVSKDMDPSVRVRCGEDGAVAHFTGLQLCGAIHVCPVCAPRIRQERANDIDAAASAWLEKNGVGTVLLLTLTMPHGYGERLADLLRTIRASFGALVSGRAWQTLKLAYGLSHYIVSHDTTVGVNGWHPHLHILVFALAELDDDQITALGDAMHTRWKAAIVKRGHDAPSREHGIKLERARSRQDVTRYVSQVSKVVAGDALDDSKAVPVALEIARGDLKTSRHAGQRTHWQVLADIVARRAGADEWTTALDAEDDRDKALWLEWEQATKGLRAIRWSKGLRVLVGLDVEELSDEAIVAQEIGGIEVHAFSPDEWKAIATTPGGRALILRAAETLKRQEVERVTAAILRKANRRRRKREKARRESLRQWGRAQLRDVTQRDDSAHVPLIGTGVRLVAASPGQGMTRSDGIH